MHLRRGQVRSLAFCDFRSLHDLLSVRIDVDTLLEDAEALRDEEHSENPKKRKVEELSDEDSVPKKVKKLSGAASSSKLATGTPETDPKPARIRFTAPVTPCCLCADPHEQGLLRIHNPPAGWGADKATSGEKVWRAHEACAKVLPETWVDEVNGVRVVLGVDCIEKDRWALVSLTCQTATSLLDHLRCNPEMRRVHKTRPKSPWR